MTTHDDSGRLDDDLGAEIDALADDPRALRRLLRGKCAKEAVKALVSVCRDPRAPAPAKATSGAALLRAGGHFEKFDVDEEAQPVTIESCDRTIAALEALIAKVDKTLPPNADPKPPRTKKPGSAGLFD